MAPGPAAPQVHFLLAHAVHMPCLLFSCGGRLLLLPPPLPPALLLLPPPLPPALLLQQQLLPPFSAALSS